MSVYIVDDHVYVYIQLHHVLPIDSCTCVLQSYSS